MDAFKLKPNEPVTGENLLKLAHTIDQFEQYARQHASQLARFAEAIGIRDDMLMPPVCPPRPAGGHRRAPSEGQDDRRSRRIRSLASLPGEPITQPPGWVPEPHW